eukprot:scpid54092/ scgid16091/ 
MASMKVDNFVKPFGGRAGQSWEQFWEKFLVLANFQGWDSEEKPMKNFPLFLDGVALLVYSKMKEDDRRKKDEVVKSISLSFSMTKSSAYRAFVSRRLKVDESADAYVADLQRLAGLSGHNVTGSEDAMILEQLVYGLSPEFAREVRLSMASKKMTVRGCLDGVRALQSAIADCPVTQSSSGISAAATSGCVDQSRGSVLSFRCGKIGHIRRNCPQRNSDVQQSSHGKPRRATCYFCNQEGHVKAECPERRAWQSSRQGKSAGVSNGGTGEKCLCTISVTSTGVLPRIFVDVAALDRRGNGSGYSRSSTAALRVH